MDGATGKSRPAFGAVERPPPNRGSLPEPTHGGVAPPNFRPPLWSGSGQRDEATAVTSAASIEDFDIRVSVEFKAGNGNHHPLRHVVNNLTNESLTPCRRRTQTKVGAIQAEILPDRLLLRRGREWTV